METIKNELILCCIEDLHDVIDVIIRELGIEVCAFDVKLLLSEAMMNAHYHGNKGDNTKPIYIRYKLQGMHLNIEVEDCGTAPVNVSIPREIDNDKLLDDGGRGLFLVHSLSDQVEMTNNTLHIYKILTVL